jgi:hypothetical protein
MANFAIVNNDLVTNVIIADNAETALTYGGGTEVLETTGQPWIGWFRVNGEWHEPVVADENSEAND